MHIDLFILFLSYLFNICSVRFKYFDNISCHIYVHRVVHSILLSFNVCRICRLAPLSFGGVGNLYLLLFFASLARALSVSLIFSKNSFLLISIFPYCFSSFTFVLISTINLYYFFPLLCFGFVLDFLFFWYF